MAEAGYLVPTAAAMGKGASSNEFLTSGKRSRSIKSRTLGDILETGSHWKSRLRLVIEIGSVNSVATKFLESGNNRRNLG